MIFRFFLKELYIIRCTEILENPDFQNIKTDFRENTKFALIDEFQRNQCQNEAYGLYFQEKIQNFKFLNFMIGFHIFENNQ